MAPLSCSAREMPFSFTCNRCSFCCKEKIIRVNPYEAARLAAHFGVTTSFFLKTYTMAQGTILTMPHRGFCIFRNYAGCAVHKDRPLVCRLYPLRRNTGDNHTETFSLVDIEPQCVALEGNYGTIGKYLVEQETDEYVEAADSYISLADTLIDALRKEIQTDQVLAQEAVRLCTAPDIYGDKSIPAWLDADPVVSRFCADRRLPQPKTPSEKMQLHIAAVSEIARRAPAPSERHEHVKTLARSAAILGYSIGVNLEELSAEFLSIFENPFT